MFEVRDGNSYVAETLLVRTDLENLKKCKDRDEKVDKVG